MKDCRNEYSLDLIQKMYNILVLSMSSSMKLFLRHKDLHAYGKICESVHKTASANKICKRKRNFAKV